MSNLRIESVLISSLSFDTTNARRHDAKNLASIEGSLRLFGQRKPIVVTGANVVVAGNGTLEAAKSLGWSEISVVRIPNDWTAEQVKAYALADNRTAELAEWDAKILADQLIELDAVGWDVSEFGFDALEPPVNLDDDEPLSFDEVESKVKLGELWQLGEHRLLCGDSTDEKSVAYLMDGELADLVFTDPPYNTRMAQGRTSSEWDIINNDNLSDTDFNSFCKLFIVNIYKFAKEDSHKYICMGWSAYHILYPAMPQVKNCIVWVKNNFGLGHGYRPQHEFILFDGGNIEANNQSNVWHCNKDSASTYKHPTQKPSELSAIALKNSSNKDNIVLDIFGGSGSTLIACEKLNRRCRMIELEPKYCDVIIERWERLTGLTATRLEQ
jgi:DNA modification methylase